MDDMGSGRTMDEGEAIETTRPGWQFALVSLALGVAFVLLVLEVALRIHNPIHVPLRANDIALPAGKRDVQHVEGVEEARVDAEIVRQYNNLGFRGPDRGDDFEERLSVVMVGGSTTFCIGLGDEHAWPTLLAERLGARFDTLWLNNAGMDGHSTFGHLMLLRQALGELRPDFIVYMIGINDVGREDLNDDDLGLDPSSAAGLSSVVRHSELLSTLQVLWRTMRAYELGVATFEPVEFDSLPRRVEDEATRSAALSEHESRFLPLYRRRVERLVDETREFGSEPVLMTQPALYGDDPDPSTGLELGSLEWVEQSASLRWEILERYNDVTRDVAREKGVHLVDLAATLEKDTRYYFDFIHYTIEGSSRVAELVSEGLAPALESARGGAD